MRVIGAAEVSPVRRFTLASVRCCERQPACSAQHSKRVAAIHHAYMCGRYDHVRALSAGVCAAPHARTPARPHARTRTSIVSSWSPANPLHPRRPTHARIDSTPSSSNRFSSSSEGNADVPLCGCPGVRVRGRAGGRVSADARAGE